MAESKTFTKHIKYSGKRGIKEADTEVELQRAAAKHGFAPAVISCTFLEDECIVVMENVGECLFSNPMYKDNAKNIPVVVWNQIERMLRILYEVEGIEYIDITSFNFTEMDGKIYVIDFGDASYRVSENGEKPKYGDKPKNYFLREFLEGEYGWNPDMA